jgi:class 3 adenylate cyclase
MVLMNPLLSNNRRIALQARAIPIKRGKRRELTVGFFDLSNSTSRKLGYGHLEGFRAMSVHNEICVRFGSSFGGRVVKVLGDGVLITFDDPLKAVLAALNIRYALAKVGKLFTKVGLTTGLVEIVKVGSRNDVLGSTVDRCARLESIASAGEILIDRPLYDSVRSYLKDYKGVLVSHPTTCVLTGIGETEVREVYSEPFHGSYLRSSRQAFRLDEGGRLSLAEKVKFLEGTQSEMGIGLNTFASYFHKFNRALFKDHVRSLVKRGVSFKCLAIDPDTEVARAYCEDREEQDYLRGTKSVFDQLLKVRDEFLCDNLRGSFELHTYPHMPYFHATCCDIGEERPSRSGRMIISNYLYGTKRSDCPVVRFSARSNPKLFDTYWSSIRGLLRESHRCW